MSAPSDPLRLHTHLARQLAWRGLPRVGRTLTLELGGVPTKVEATTLLGL